jgi:two-component system response regulator HydG
MKMLIVEDSSQLADRLANAFEESGYDVRKVATLSDAREQIAVYWPDFVLLDANFPTKGNTRAEFNAAALLDLLACREYVAPTVILMSGDDRTALHFDKIRAWLNTGRIADVLPKNVEGGWDFLKELLVHRVEILRSRRFHPELDDEAKNLQWLYRNGIVSREEEMLKIAGIIRRIVNRTENTESILITGASGSGKGMISRAIHTEMSRKAQRELPFVTVQCGTLISTLAASELLGHVKGTFTDAKTDKVGCLESAADGVLFLDDIHLLPKEVLGVFLSALQERMFRRLGASKITQFEARVVSTTNVDLDELEKRGQMPDEFYNRIARDTIVVPSLVQRPRDIEPLMKHFLSKGQQTAASLPHEFHPDVIKAFQAYSWPGDIRQLENVVTTICTHVQDKVVDLDALQGLDLKYKSRSIEWDPTPELQREQDLLLYRVEWRCGWTKLGDSEFSRTKNWLKELLHLNTGLIDDLSNQVQGRANPKAIHFLKALLLLALVEGNRAHHREFQKALDLGWDYTNRVLCFLAGIDCDGLAGFSPPLLTRSWEGGKWVYALSARPMNTPQAFGP